VADARQAGGGPPDGGPTATGSGGSWKAVYAADDDLPASGPGSVAGFGPRFLAFLIDGLLADLLAVIVDGGFHNSGRHSLASYLAFLLIEIVFVTLAGQTPGMRVVGIAVLRADGNGRPALQWVLLRTVLLAVVVPAVITDARGRGMHDRAVGTVMIHTR
jgi:uncharacterized RDD family membrane protein YckC